MGSLHSFQSHLKLKINDQEMINTQNYLSLKYFILYPIKYKFLLSLLSFYPVTTLDNQLFSLFLSPLSTL